MKVPIGQEIGRPVSPGAADFCLSPDLRHAGRHAYDGGMTETRSTQTADPNQFINMEPDFRQIPGGRWIFNGCTKAFGFATRERAEQAHPLTREMRNLPRDAQGKLNRADMRRAKALESQISELCYR